MKRLVCNELLYNHAQPYNAITPKGLQKRRPAMSDTITVGTDLGDKYHIAVVF